MDQILGSIRRMIAESAPTFEPPGPVAENGGAAETEDYRLGQEDFGSFSAGMPESVDTDSGALVDFTQAIEEARATLEAAGVLPGAGATQESLPEERSYGERPLWPSERTVGWSSSMTSAETQAAVGGAFNELSAFLAARTGRGVDDLVEDLLRPLLKDWLDTNLPALVERLVREEIGKLSRGSR
jgi:cell pole-organizing protein PopZ